MTDMQEALAVRLLCWLRGGAKFSLGGAQWEGIQVDALARAARPGSVRIRQSQRAGI